MSEKPDFRVEAGGKGLDADRRRAWFQHQNKDADRQGARWHRYSYEEATGALLYEGWKVRPKVVGEAVFEGLSGPRGGR